MVKNLRLLIFLFLFVGISYCEEYNSTEIAVVETATQLRAKRQWGGCNGYGCNGNPGCGPNGCGFTSGCIGYGCGGYGGGSCGCCSQGCGQMCCQNRQPRPCLNCGSSYRCCPCCMPACSRSCVRGGGCFCDYGDYGGWGRKRRQALDFDRANSTEIIEE